MCNTCNKHMMELCRKIIALNWCKGMLSPASTGVSKWLTNLEQSYPKGRATVRPKCSRRRRRVGRGCRQWRCTQSRCPGGRESRIQRPQLTSSHQGRGLDWPSPAGKSVREGSRGSGWRWRPSSSRRSRGRILPDQDVKKIPHGTEAASTADSCTFRDRKTPRGRWCTVSCRAPPRSSPADRLSSSSLPRLQSSQKHRALAPA
jgi:hypothetical protein